MQKGEELVKYVTQRLVELIDMPGDVRKERRHLRRSARQPWTARWFGLIPMSVSLLLKRKNKVSLSVADADVPGSGSAAPRESRHPSQP